jgi:hypothetical protein
MLPVQLRKAQFIAKAYSFEGQANGLATRYSTHSALTAGLFRSAHPGHLGLRVGVVGYVLLKEFFIALQHTRCGPTRLYWIAQFAACSVIGCPEGTNRELLGNI